MKRQILVVDDDSMLCELLDHLLTDAGYHVDTLADPRAVLSFLTEHPVDLVLLDVLLPFIDGFTLAARIRVTFPNLPLIFLTVRAQTDDKVRGLAIAADYLTKPFAPAELLARIQNVLERAYPSGQQPMGIRLTVGNATLDVTRLQFREADGPAILLTPIEMQLLAYLMRHAGQVVSRTTLIDAAWGNHSEGLNNRLDVYIRRLRRKIEPIPTKPRYVQTVRGKGYVFREWHSPRLG